jgi:hypothetical protein
MDKITRKQGLFAFTTGLFLILFSGNIQAQCLTSTGPTNDCGYGDAIDNITINAVSVSNAGCSGTSTGYTYFPSPIWNLTLGSTNPISLAVGGATYNQGVMIWIDINNNGQFEATEVVYTSTGVAQTHTGNLVIPAAGATAIVRMRVMCAYNTTPTATDACTSNIGSYGETEDYQVSLTGGVVPGPDASAGAVLSPTASSCGNALDSVMVRIYNPGTDTLNNFPIETNLTGLGTGTFANTITQILPGDSATVFVTTVNTLPGGNLDVELITQFTGDINPANDTLNESITILNAEPITITGPTSVCSGSDATLQLNLVPGETYTWYQDSVGGSMILNADSLIATGLTSDTTFAVSSSNTCRAGDTISIAVLATDPIMVTGPDSICDGAAFTLTLNDLSGEIYTWYQDSVGGTVLTTGPSFSGTASSGSTVFVAESSNGCRPTGLWSVVVLPLPTASFTSSVSNDTVNFSSTLANTNSVFWDFGDGNTSTQTNPTNVFGVTGSFTVCLTAINDCDSVTVCDTVTSTVLVGIPGFDDAKISLYPNPTEDKLTVQLANMEGMEGEWTITDLQGRVIRRQDFKLTNGNDQSEVSLGNLASGTYLFQLRTDGYTYNSRIVKQ